jgi:hypothetical protein
VANVADKITQIMFFFFPPKTFKKRYSKISFIPFEIIYVLFPQINDTLSQDTRQIKQI